MLQPLTAQTTRPLRFRVVFVCVVCAVAQRCAGDQGYSVVTLSIASASCPANSGERLRWMAGTR